MTMRMVIPTRQRGQLRHWSMRSATQGWLHLLRIDLKRGGGIWMVPVTAVFAWLILRNALTPGVALWPEITSAISTTSMRLVIAAVAIGGLFGGRERRRELAELTSATAMAIWQRYLSLTVSIFLWTVASYALVGVPLLTCGALRATWGGPDLSVLIAPLPVMALGAVFGVQVGRIMKERTAPIVALAAFLLLFVILTMADQSLYLLNVLGLNSWFRPVVENAPERPSNILFQLAWVSGLVGTVVGLGIWWERRTMLPRLLTVISIAVACNGAAGIIVAGPPDHSSHISSARLMVQEASTCDDTQPIAVCVHPAYERMLTSVSNDVNTYLGPLAGLPGVADQVYISSGNKTGSNWNQDNDYVVSSIDLSFGEAADDLIVMDLWPMSFMAMQTGQGRDDNEMQYVVMTALARNIGLDEWPGYFYRIPESAESPSLQDAIDRFAALTPDEQRAWLETNWDALRAGSLTLEGLP